MRESSEISIVPGTNVTLKSALTRTVLPATSISRTVFLRGTVPLSGQYGCRELVEHFLRGRRQVGPVHRRESLLSKVAHHAFGKLPAAGFVEDASDNVNVGWVEDPLEVDFSQPALDRNVSLLDGVRQWKQLFSCSVPRRWAPSDAKARSNHPVFVEQGRSWNRNPRGQR